MVSKSDNLQKIRRLRAGWVVALLLLAVSVVLYYVLPWSLVVRQTIVLVCVVFYAIATFLAVFARCPRCGHLFHNVLGFSNPLSRSCSQCGLSLPRE
jgi:hypothetical protein